jgi:hypothetical protein
MVGESEIWERESKRQRDHYYDRVWSWSQCCIDPTCGSESSLILGLDEKEIEAKWIKNSLTSILQF